MKNKHKGKSAENGGIAVVGMSCRFPGADHYRTFWSNLINGVSSITEVPKERWDIDQHYSPDFDAPGKSISKWGGFLENIDSFDNRFFNISSREAKTMEPQQRLLLEECWRCVEDSGISLGELRSRVTSVYIGVISMNYYQTDPAVSNTANNFSTTGNYSSILSNRLSYHFGFRGISLILDTACASSMIAVNLAKQSIKQGESDFSLVGAINLSYSPVKYLLLSKSRLLSPDGKCRTFDKDANGYVPGEGVAALLLQPLHQAVRDGNEIYGVLKGSATNHVGQARALTAPSVNSYTDLLLNAYKNSKVDPASIGYIESYSTGTSIGDPIEVEGLTRAFRHHTDMKGFCHIGSLKANIGHLEATSGIASLIKVLLIFKYKKIPPTLNVEHLNPLIDFDDSPFRLVQKLTDWHPPENQPRRAGISSVGFGGVNTHIVLEEYLGEEVKQLEQAPRKNQFFLLSAKSRNSLDALLKSWKQYVQSEDFLRYSLDEICHTLRKGRESFPYRFALLVSDKETLKQELEKSEIPSLMHTQKRDLLLKIGNPPSIDFNQFCNCFQDNAAFREAISECKNAISEVIYQDLIENPSGTADRFNKLYGFSILYLMVKMILDHGNAPDLLCGEGIGQWVALSICGIATLKECLHGILNPEVLTEMVLKRPEIPFYLQSNDIILYPFYFDERYREKLLQEVEIPNELLFHYIQKANLLLKNQFTFKKSIDEWRESLEGEEKKDLNALLEENQWWENNDPQTRSDKALTLIIILNCLRDLNRKWDLTDKDDMLPVSIQEILDLLTDQLITTEELVRLFRTGNDGINSILDQFHARQHGLDQNKPYTLLRSMNKTLHELSGNEHWIESFGKEAIPMDRLNHFLTISIGTLSVQQAKEDNLKLEMSEEVEKQFSILLLNLWQHGVNPDWKEYFQSNVTRKAASLPVYCFDRKKFWIDDEALQEIPEEEEAPFRGSSLTRLLDHSERFVCPFQLHRDWILQDHRIANFHVIPDSLMLDLVFEAYRQSDQVINLITDMVIWKSGIIQSRSAVIVSLEKGNGFFEIIDPSGLLCSGQAKTIEIPNQSAIDPEGLKQSEVIDSESIYNYFANIGYHYGAGLRVIQSLWYGEGFTLFELKPRKSIDPSLTNFDPCILDGVFQCVIRIGEERRENLDKNSLLLPYQIGSLKFHSPLENNCYVVVENKNLRFENNDLIVSVNVYDQEGILALELQETKLKHVFSENLQIIPDVERERMQREGMLTRFFSPAWASVENVQPKNGNYGDEDFLIFSGKGGIAEYLASILNSQGITPLVVYLGESYQKTDAYHYRINPNRIEDVTRIFQNLSPSNGESDSNRTLNIFYFPTFGVQKISTLNINEIIKSQETGIYPFFQLSKAIHNRFQHQQVKITIPTLDCFITDPKDMGGGFVNGGITGLSKVLELENRQLSVKQIDFSSSDQQSARSICDILLQEHFNSSQDREIAIRGQEKLVKQLQAVPPSATSIVGNVFRENSVYIIVGKVKQPGLALAIDILSKTDAKVILLDKVEPDEQTKDQLSKLAGFAHQLEHHLVDICNLNELNNILEHIRNHYKKISGIIHTDGLMRSKHLAYDGLQFFQEVSAQKILGLMNLHEATKEDDLDFFIVFSSIISIIGDFGQAGYAAVNSFLDYFIQHRKQQGGKGRSIGINWPAWEDIPGHQHQIAQQLELRGILSIETTQGLKVIEQILRNSTDHVVVVVDDNETNNFAEIILNSGN